MDIANDIRYVNKDKIVFEAHRISNQKWRAEDFISHFDRVSFYDHYVKPFNDLFGTFTAPENGDYQFAFYAIPFQTDKIEVKAVKNGRFTNTLEGVINIYGYPWKISLARNDKLRLKLTDGILITRWTLTCHLVKE